MVSTLIFDFDGTIADSFEGFIQIVQQLSVKHSIPALSRIEIEGLRSESAQSVFKKFKIPFYKIPFLARDFKQLQRGEIFSIKTFPDLPEVLRELKVSGLSLAVVTSNSAENVKLFLKNNNLEVFDFVYGDSSVFGKDSMLKRFLKQNNLSKADVVYVGDEVRDIHACKKVGIKIISVTWGFNTEESLRAEVPDFIVSSPNEILDALKAM